MYKVLFIANEIQIGGATKELLHLVSNLSNEFKPIILVNKEGPLTEICKSKNIDYIILKFKPFSIGTGTTKLKQIIKKIILPFLKLQYLIYNKLALKKIDKLIDMNSISIIHTNVNRDDFGALLSKKYNIPHVWHLREFGDIDYKCYFFRKNYIDFMNNNTDYFVAISNVIKDNFIKKGIDKRKIKLIYDGIKINKDFNKTFSNNKLKVLFMGGIQESKGQIELIESLNLLPKNISNNIYVDFYGQGTNDYIKFLNKKINAYNLKNINFNDYKNDIEKIIKNYDVGIMCSKSEAFGLVTIEYMTNKLITIVPNTGACPELVTNTSGFVYEYGNYKNLSDIILKIYNMPLEEKNKISQKGFERSKFFSSKNNAEKIETLYKQLLK